MTMMTIDEAIAYLNQDFTGYPEEAIQAFLENPAEAEPKIFKEMYRALELQKKDELPPEANAAWMGLLHLALVKQPGSLQRLGEFLKKAGEYADPYYDDLLTVYLRYILWTLYEKEGDADLLECWVLDTEIDQWARTSMLDALAALVVDGRYPKGRFIALCDEMARQAEQGKDFGYAPAQLTGIAVCNGWKELVPAIKKLEEEEAIEEISIGYKDYMQMLENPDQFFKTNVSRYICNFYRFQPMTMEGIEQNLFPLKKDISNLSQRLAPFSDLTKPKIAAKPQSSPEQKKQSPAPAAKPNPSSGKDSASKIKKQKKAAKKARKKNKK